MGTGSVPNASIRRTKVKLSVNQYNFAAALSIVRSAISTRSTLPVLSNVLLATDRDQLRLTGTNRKIAITVWIGAKVEDDGAITIPARLLSEFVDSLPSERIDINLQERNLTLNLTCAGYTANMKGIAADEFPLIPKNENDEHQQIDAAILRSMIDRVAFAASGDSINRPALSGVLVSTADDIVTMAATDGYCLSEDFADMTTGIESSVVIPATSLRTVAAIAAGASADYIATYSTTENAASFSFIGEKSWRRCEVAAELIASKYPDYKRIIPETGSAKTTVTIDAKALNDAMKMALVFARNNSVNIDFIGEHNVVTISAEAAEIGDSKTEIECTIIGDDLSIMLDAGMLLSALGNIGGHLLTIEMTEPNKPVTIRTDNSDVLYVQMPMHPGP